MTPNQKAATYVGWSPCNGQVPCDRLSHEKPIPDSETFHGCSIWTHDAPDMSKPENYMRAVAEMAVPDNWERADGGFSKALYLTALGHPGPPIVMFLAALYDAENPE